VRPLYATGAVTPASCLYEKTDSISRCSQWPDPSQAAVTGAREWQAGERGRGVPHGGSAASVTSPASAFRRVSTGSFGLYSSGTEEAGVDRPGTASPAGRALHFLAAGAHPFVLIPVRWPVSAGESTAGCSPGVGLATSRLPMSCFRTRIRPRPFRWTGARAPMPCVAARRPESLCREAGS
jgi:hypothetical protein